MDDIGGSECRGTSVDAVGEGPVAARHWPVRWVRSRLPVRSGRLAAVSLLVLLVSTAGCAGLAADGDGNGTAGGASGATVEASPVTPTPGTPSYDDDGLPAERERLLGTDPTVADTDGDGLDDHSEVTRGTDPLVADTDGDGVTDGREVEYGLDPILADTDGDGLDDGTELAGETDPLVADTDDDGALDGAEVEAGTNPVLADTDGDGLDDGTELAGETDPLAADTDDDALDDARELSVGTDPTDPDTDGDSLLDGWEVRGHAPENVTLPGANPLRKDLYVMVSRTKSAWAMRESDRTYIRGAFDRMNVENPDGTTGISVHFVAGERLSIDRSFRTNGSARRALRRNSTAAVVGPRADVYHHVILMRLDDRNNVFDGYATTPGRTVLVDEDERDFRGGTLPYRDRLIVRGLLQNVAGRPAPEHRHRGDARFTKTGWTAYRPNDVVVHEYLPRHLATKLEREGFATSPATD
ncbi:hypothetical protein ACFR97_01155 [Haloplanus litoreus]|uniref:hypothetical protein n=1 Tax=Haloplanus litoreus TaxID=767515 RepID=UPI0036385A90